LQSLLDLALNTDAHGEDMLFNEDVKEPIRANLTGGMDRLPDLADITNRIRVGLNKKVNFVVPLL
jgi:fatty acid synthase subunit alpha, fungi type